MKTLFLPFAFLILFLSSCSRDDISQDDNKLVNPVDVYVAGNEFGKACYWKNGLKQLLSGGTGNYAEQIIVENNNIYVLGGVTAEYGDTASNPKKFLWINGTKFNLEDYLGLTPNPNSNNPDYSIFRKMILDNGNLYFFGKVKNPNPTTPQDAYLFCYWKNGIMSVITNNAQMSELLGFNVFNNNVYTAIRQNISINGAGNPTWNLSYYKNDILEFSEIDGFNRGFFSDNTGNVFSLTKNHYSNQLYYKDYNTNNITTVPTNISQNNPFIVVWEGNNKYYISYTSYYLNSNFIQNNDPNGYNQTALFVVKNQNFYTLRYHDTFNHTAKIFINNVETQSIPITSVLDPNASSFLGLFVVQN